MSDSCTLERFQKDTKDHQMKVLLDQDGYRHLQFRKPGTYAYGFDIVTWPGYLSITGDMGADTFSRLNDMFEFFRSDSGRINAPYWAEKVVTCDSRRERMEFDSDLAKARVTEMLTERFEDDAVRQAEALEAAKDINYHDGETRCYDSFMNNLDELGMSYEEFPDANVWKFHYIWRLYAIVHAIATYDALTPKPEEAE